VHRLFGAGPSRRNERLLDDERPHWSPLMLALVRVQAQMLMRAGEADEFFNHRSILQTT